MLFRQALLHHLSVVTEPKVSGILDNALLAGLHPQLVPILKNKTEGMCSRPPEAYPLQDGDVQGLGRHHYNEKCGELGGKEKRNGL